MKVPTSELNACVRKAVEQNPPRSVGGGSASEALLRDAGSGRAPDVRPFREQSAATRPGVRTLPLPGAARRLRLRGQPDPFAGTTRADERLGRAGSAVCLQASSSGPCRSGSGGGGSCAGSTSGSTAAEISARRMFSVSSGPPTASGSSPGRGKGAAAVLIARGAQRGIDLAADCRAVRRPRPPLQPLGPLPGGQRGRNRPGCLARHRPARERTCARRLWRYAPPGAARFGREPARLRWSCPSL